MAAGLKMLFAGLRLAFTCPTHVGLIALNGGRAAATTDTHRSVYVAAADYATGILKAALLGFYTIAAPVSGTLAIGLVMHEAVFSKTAAYLGMFAVVLGIVSEVGPLLSSALDSTTIFASLLVTVRFLLLGWRLYWLVQQ